MGIYKKEEEDGRRDMSQQKEDEIQYHWLFYVWFIAVEENQTNMYGIFER